MTQQEIQEALKDRGVVEVSVGDPEDLNALNKKVREVVRIGQDMGVQLIEGFVRDEKDYIVRMAMERDDTPL